MKTSKEDSQQMTMGDSTKSQKYSKQSKKWQQVTDSFAYFIAKDIMRREGRL